MPARKQQSESKWPPTAYSYIRFSTPAQAEGDSMRRQTELRDGWLKKSGAVLDTSLTLRDEGVSAFTGSHRDNPDRNALAGFLELVKRGRIPRGSYLVLESLDRLTREHIRPALTLLLNLIDAGVRVVQLLPVENVYDENVEPMTLMMAVMELSRGHSESKVKSERLGRAWAEKKRKAAEGVPLTKALPAWVRQSGERLELIPEKAAAVKRIFALATGGYGLGAITKKLNSEGVPPIARAAHWARSYVCKILASRATFGEYQPHRGHVGPDRKPDGPPVSNYFPAVISEDTWHAAQSALASRRQTGGRPSPKVWVFSGMLHDARDGGSMHIVDKGRKASGPALVSYKAAQGITGTKYVSFPADVFEAGLLRRIREIKPKDVLPDHNAADDRVAVLEGKHDELADRVKAIQEQLVQGGDLAPLIQVLRTLDAEMEKVGAELATVRREAASPLSVAWGEARNLLDVIESAPDPAEARTRLRGVFRRLITDIRCLFVDRGAVRFAAAQLWFAGGSAERLAILYHRRGHGNGDAKRPATWDIVSRAATPKPGTFDLRQPREVAALEKFLNKLDVSKL